MKSSRARCTRQTCGPSEDIENKNFEQKEKKSMWKNLYQKILKDNLYISLGLNLFVIIALTIGIIVGVVLYHSSDPYIKFGPQDSLVVLTFQINTGGKYAALIVTIIAYAIVDNFISNTTNNELWNNIFSTSVVRIYNYKHELELMGLAQVIYLCNSIRGALAVKIMVTQLDLALIIVGASWSINWLAIYINLENKCFGPDDGLPNNGRGCKAYYDSKEKQQLENKKVITDLLKSNELPIFKPARKEVYQNNNVSDD